MVEMVERFSFASIVLGMIIGFGGLFSAFVPGVGQLSIVIALIGLGMMGASLLSMAFFLGTATEGDSDY